ncbi:General transcription and DNA repair factor IIH helicase subunit [Phytophthora cactorum]|nr:General transcription and DNA repair factor IIH helicase subunit [Phytophthora cactorum]KAG3045055.1 General transcription and DNA repair factor IIH helicase subunit [Phytophthora cactorum]
MIANPVLPDDVLDEAIPGNIRRAEHFVAFMRRLIEYLRKRIRVRQVESETPQAFLHHLHQAINMEIKPMKFCYTRLNSLLRTLEVTNLEEYNSLTDVADFATLVATYAEGFMLIIEPFDSASGVHDPVLQLSCLDASLAIRPVFERFSSVVITSGTLSPIDLYPRLLNFNPVIRESLPMSVYRSSICPLVITRGSDQMPVSTKFDLRDDLSVVRNYGTLLLEMAACTPDGMVCFFPSYLYMEKIIGQWDSLGVLKRVLSSKLLFIETKDIVETTLALDNYKKACDCGRGAIFFSVARGKVAEGIDFDRHYGRAVILFGIPFQYTLSNTLRARLEYLRYTHQIREGDFLTFDALRQAAQCAGRVLRSKTDYGLVIFADSRYNRADKRTKLPPWILQFLVDSHLNLSVDMAVFMAKKYLSLMAQPVDESTNVNSILLDAGGVAKWLGKHPKEDESME